MQHSSLRRGKLLAVVLAAVMLVSSMFAFSACTLPQGEVKLSGIEITAQPTKTAYVEGETFDPTGMKVSAVYTDNSKKELTAEQYNYDLKRELTLEDKYVVVAYLDKMTQVDITVGIDAAAEISITTEPTKTEYTEGEKFDPAGLVISVTTERGKEKSVTWTAEDERFTIDTETALAIDTTDITIGYDEATATQTITVNPRPVVLTGITLSGDYKTEYFDGESFDTTGLTVTADYDNDTHLPVSKSTDGEDDEGYTVEPAGALTTATETVTISYQGKTETINVTVKPDEVKSIAVKTPPTKTKYLENEKFEPDGLVLEITYQANDRKADLAWSEDNADSFQFDVTTVTRETKSVTVTYGEHTAQITIVPSQLQNYTSFGRYLNDCLDEGVAPAFKTETIMSYKPYAADGKNYTQMSGYATDGEYFYVLVTGGNGERGKEGRIFKISMTDGTASGYSDSFTARCNNGYRATLFLKDSYLYTVTDAGETKKIATSALTDAGGALEDATEIPTFAYDGEAKRDIYTVCYNATKDKYVTYEYLDFEGKGPANEYRINIYSSAGVSEKTLSVQTNAKTGAGEDLWDAMLSIDDDYIYLGYFNTWASKAYVEGNTNVYDWEGNRITTGSDLMDATHKALFFTSPIAAQTYTKTIGVFAYNGALYVFLTNPANTVGCAFYKVYTEAQERVPIEE